MTLWHAGPATLYPLGDPLPDGITLRDGVEARAQLTGEKRPPKAGEWYLSGAIPTAYLSRGGGTAPYMICRIVLVRKRITWDIVG